MVATRHRPCRCCLLGAALFAALIPGCKSGDPGALRDAALDRERPAEAASDGEADAEGEGGCIRPPDLGADEDAVDSGREAAAPDGPALDVVQDGGPSPCPAGMALFAKQLCIDRYEASRPDATGASQGVQVGAAQCKAGVIPWHAWTLTQSEAAAACALAGKRLCTATEWQAACAGPQKQTYSYGNAYAPATCNGIDTFCLCGAGDPCAAVSPCPYPHCFNLPPPAGAPAQGCGAAFHVTATGAHPGCENGLGIYDLNGNVWELVQSSDGLDHFRGGAYNCGDSETLHRCDYDATWGPSAQGFRCCADPAPAGDT